MKGITPAYAGKRPRSTSCFLPCWDHPRICGEKCIAAVIAAPMAGSPPHMRGKATVKSLREPTARITPAYAGKRLHRFDHCRLQRDHPRICGEKSLPRQCTCHPWGSPPHMRGKEQAFRLDASELGITPAYAGKSCRGKQRRACQRDHPRICGEKLFFCWFASARLGSPPHMRGKGSMPKP